MEEQKAVDVGPPQLLENGDVLVLVLVPDNSFGVLRNLRPTGWLQSEETTSDADSPTAFRFRTWSCEWPDRPGEPVLLYLIFSMAEWLELEGRADARGEPYIDAQDIIDQQMNTAQAWERDRSGGQCLASADSADDDLPF